MVKEFETRGKRRAVLNGRTNAFGQTPYRLIGRYSEALQVTDDQIVYFNAEGSAASPPDVEFDSAEYVKKEIADRRKYESSVKK